MIFYLMYRRCAPVQKYFANSLQGATKITQFRTGNAIKLGQCQWHDSLTNRLRTRHWWWWW